MNTNHIITLGIVLLIASAALCLLGIWLAIVPHTFAAVLAILSALAVFIFGIGILLMALMKHEAENP